MSWAIGIVIAIVLAIISFFILSFPLQVTGQQGIPFILQPGQKVMQTFPLKETECRLLCIKYKSGEQVDLTKLKACEEKFHLNCYKPQYQQVSYITQSKIVKEWCNCVFLTSNPECQTLTRDLFGNYENLPKTSDGYPVITLPDLTKKPCDEICQKFTQNLCKQRNCLDSDKGYIQNCVVAR